MITVFRTSSFHAWLKRLEDKHARAMILNRIRSLERGGFGDCRSVAKKVWELRIHVGPGYRVYFTRQDELRYILLCGGVKRSQQRDIRRAQRMAEIVKVG